jgi:putative oxidoreductase
VFLHRLLATEARVAPLLLRLTLGGVMLPHGMQKVFDKGIGETTAGFVKMGFPAPIAFVGAVAEFVGAVLLLLGLTTRLAGLALAVQMAVAAKQHLDNGFYMNWFGNQKGEGYEYHLLAIGIGLALTFTGGGVASVDALLARKLAERSVRGGVVPGAPPPAAPRPRL